MTIRLLIALHLGTFVLLSSEAFAQPAAPPPMTLWRFLGLPQGAKFVRDQTINRRGNTPRLERRPPLAKLADPANLESLNPAIKAAAEIKQAEDMAAQKVKAIKWLAKIGCGCYDKDEKVTKALVAAMSLSDECTERVRLEAVKAVQEAADGECCGNCSQRCCCNDKILEALAKIAYERDEHGCWLEPSERVRNAAVEALETCCPSNEPVEIISEEIEGATPKVEGAEKDGSLPTPPTPPTPDAAGLYLPIPNRLATFSMDNGVVETARPKSVSRNRSVSLAPAGLARNNPNTKKTVATKLEDAISTIPNNDVGAIVTVNVRLQQAEIRLLDREYQLTPGSSLKVYQRSPSGPQQVGVLVVEQASPGSAIVTPVGKIKLKQVRRGDVVVVSR